MTLILNFFIESSKTDQYREGAIVPIDNIWCVSSRSFSARRGNFNQPCTKEQTINFLGPKNT